MSETKFTPGPWRNYAPEIAGKTEETYRTICAGREFGSDERGFQVTGIISIENANLLSSSPDLYYQLEKMIHAAKSAIEIAESVIAKPIQSDAEADYQVGEARNIFRQIKEAENALAKARGEI